MPEKAERKRYRTPRTEIAEMADSMLLRAEMPGVEKGDFDINVDGNELTISGKRKPIDPGLRLVQGESDCSDYLRVFMLGDALDTTNIDAKAENGVLALTIKKKPEVLPKKITVEVE